MIGYSLNSGLQTCVNALAVPVILFSAIVYGSRHRSSSARALAAGAVLGALGHFVARSSLSHEYVTQLYEGIEMDAMETTVIGHISVAVRSIGVLLFAYGFCVMTCGPNVANRLLALLGIESHRQTRQVEPANTGSADASLE
jgi:hypothetical protein